MTKKAMWTAFAVHIAVDVMWIVSQIKKKVKQKRKDFIKQSQNAKRKKIGTPQYAGIRV
ncbi:MAG: hypothetical protein J1D88_00715 [Treponema sp.]|nr:hypothetical protein [Treponema sp.]